MKPKQGAIRVAAILLLATGWPARAQEAQGEPPTPHRLALAQRYVAALGVDVTMESLMSSVAPSIVESLERRLGRPLPEVRRDMRRTADEAAQAAITGAMSRMIPAVASSFSDEELEAAVTYYESPTARSLLAKMPLYYAKMAPIQRQMLDDFSNQFRTRICQQADCSAPEATSRAPRARR